MFLGESVLLAEPERLDEHVNPLAHRIRALIWGEYRVTAIININL
jgi:hypothetical protein